LGGEDVSFRSIHNDSFRLKICACTDGELIWVESKTTMQQWQLIIRDISDHGPPGVPTSVVITTLKKTLLALIGSKEKVTSFVSEVDAETNFTTFTIFLRANFVGLLNSEYSFTLLPIALEEIDILKAVLRNTQERLHSTQEKLAEAREEIRKMALHPPYLKLTHNPGGEF
jgi:hypothetical protein